MHTINGGGNRPLSAVKVSKLSRNGNDPASVATSNNKKENLKHTFDKKGDWSLMTASR